MNGVEQREIFGADLFGQAIRSSENPLRTEFIEPPFTVLNARAGSWQARKRQWTSLGIRSEVGRGENLLRWSRTVSIQKDTSIFDPVLCELVYRWFSPEGGQVVDPFAGGSVRGIVAAYIGRDYWGCDLSAEQVRENRKQAEQITPDCAVRWICGDSIDELPSAPRADFVFSCPPYHNLEKYGNGPGDLSSMDWHSFRWAYKRIIARAVERMKPDTFACFVVGDIRGPDGFYRNFPGETIAGFELAGARLYNEAILVTSVGTATMRAGKLMRGGAKLVKTHQNVLVFCKGDPKAAFKRQHMPNKYHASQVDRVQIEADAWWLAVTRHRESVQYRKLGPKSLQWETPAEPMPQSGDYPLFAEQCEEIINAWRD